MQRHPNGWNILKFIARTAIVWIRVGVDGFPAPMPIRTRETIVHHHGHPASVDVELSGIQAYVMATFDNQIINERTTAALVARICFFFSEKKDCLPTLIIFGPMLIAVGLAFTLPWFPNRWPCE